MASAQIFTDGNFQGIGTDGLVVPSGKLYVYDNSTGLLATTYQDSAQTITNVNPVILSASGKAKVFLSTGTYDITLKTSAEVVVWTLNDYIADDVYTKSESDSILAARIVGTIAALRSTTYSGQPFVSVTGYYTALDNIGVREYYWDSTSTEADNGGTIIQVTGVATGRWKMKLNGVLYSTWFGAKGDGVTDDFTQLQASINTAITLKYKLIIPRKNYVITDTLVVIAPIEIDGELASIFQATADIPVFLFDEGSAGAGNYQNTFNVRNILVRTVTGTGHGYVFRNINESTFENLFVAGCGDIAFYIQGCLLSSFKHCYVGNGLIASPTFFASGASGCKTGFKTETYNGLGPNVNTFDRCTATNATVKAFDIEGAGNILIAPDAEGITSPAIGLYLNGIGTSVLGGNIEGTGNSIEVIATNCTLQDVNALSFVIIQSGVYGTTIIGGNIKYLSFQSGSFNNTAIGVRIGIGGSLADAGTDNLKLNIYNINTSSEVGMFKSGAFTPILKFGGVGDIVSYFVQAGSWWINGNIVHFNMQVQIQTMGVATGNATIDLNNIPYTPSGSRNIPCAITSNGVPVGAGYGNILPIIDAGTKNILLQKMLDTNGILSNIVNTDLGAGDSITISGFFPVTLN